MSASVGSCCAALVGSLGARVLLPNSYAYNQTQSSYWSSQEASLIPNCIVQPSDSADVARFVSIVNNVTGCQFAIKGQGHAPAAGFANINNGVTLDMTTLNKTTISSDNVTASVGSGSSWLDVYKTLNPYNKTVAGGRNGQVGVGGLTIGGGISYYSPQVGWTCDTVVNFEVVLASSDIVNANATSNPDLYRALKGGGNNYGIVTRMDFQTVETYPMLAGYVFNSPNYTYDVLNAFTNIAASSDYDNHTSIVTSLSFNTTTNAWSIVNIPIYTLPDLSPTIYDELFSIPNITELTAMSITNISTLADEPPYPQKYELFFTSTYNAISSESAPNLLSTVFDIANETLHNASLPTDMSWSLAFEPLPYTFWKHGVNDDVLGFGSADNGTSADGENYIISFFSASWDNDTYHDIAQKFGESLLAKMDAAAASAGMLQDFRYLNYADISQEVLQSYGSSQYQFLQQVSLKYDPGRIFQTRVPGGFKIGK